MILFTPTDADGDLAREIRKDPLIRHEIDKLTQCVIASRLKEQNRTLNIIDDALFEANEAGDKLYVTRKATTMFKRLICAITGHNWKMSRFQALVPGMSYICTKCDKHKQFY